MSTSVFFCILLFSPLRGCMCVFFFFFNLKMNAHLLFVLSPFIDFPETL
jgi:hypothetical protein